MLRALAGRVELEGLVNSSCVFSGAFWLDPGEGCENMLRAATENTRREAQRTARRTRAKHQEAPRSQRGESIAHSLARALRALAGGLSWDRLGRIALLGNALEILPKSLPEASREDHQEEQGESGEGRPRIETASAYYRL